MKYTEINLEEYARKKHFEHFRSMPNPHVGLTANVDVTDIVAFCKQKKASFYLTFVHIVALAANRVTALRQRILNDGIVLFDNCDTSHVELLADGTYAYCNLSHNREMPFDDYIAEAEAQREKCAQSPSIEEGDEALGLFFVTCVPWVHYTELIQPTGGNDDSNPRIAWGKFASDFNGRLQMPLSVLANHALADGHDLALFYRNVDEEIEKLLRAEGFLQNSDRTVANDRNS